MPACLTEVDIDQALPLAIDLKREELENSFYAFIRFFWSVVCKDEYRDNWHIHYISDILQNIAIRVVNREPCEHEYVVINVPPGSTKSIICSVMFPAWCWVKDETLRFITGTYEKSLATDFNVMSRNILKSDDFKMLWGDKIEFSADDDGKTGYSNIKGGGRKIASVGGSIVGRHAHIIIIDDPLNPQEIASDPVKKAAINWFDGTLSMRKVDKAITPTILIMQRLAEDDPSGHILSKYKNVFHIRIPGEMTDLDNVEPKLLEKHYKNGLFDETRFPRNILDSAREMLGGRGYSNQILQHPAAAEGTIWKREWWGFYDNFPESTPCRRIIHSWDTDFGKKAADSGGVFAREYDTGLYLTHIYAQSLEFPQLDDEIRRQVDQHGAHAVLIEDKASGQSEIQVLQQQTKIPVVAIKPIADKVSRAYAATPYVENGRIFLPRNASWVKSFIDMMAGFPDIKKKDVADAFSQMVNWVILNPCRRMGETRSHKITADDILNRKRRILSRRH